MKKYREDMYGDYDMPEKMAKTALTSLAGLKSEDDHHADDDSFSYNISNRKTLEAKKAKIKANKARSQKGEK